MVDSKRQWKAWIYLAPAIILLLVFTVWPIFNTVRMSFLEGYKGLEITKPAVEVTDEDAIATARELASVQGLLVGTSSGANVWAAKQMAEKYGKDKVIVTILADRAERYFSTALI